MYKVRYMLIHIHAHTDVHITLVLSSGNLDLVTLSFRLFIPILFNFFLSLSFFSFVKPFSTYFQFGFSCLNPSPVHLPAAWHSQCFGFSTTVPQMTHFIYTKRIPRDLDRLGVPEKSGTTWFNILQRKRSREVSQVTDAATRGGD